MDHDMTAQMTDDGIEVVYTCGHKYLWQNLRGRIDVIINELKIYGCPREKCRP